MHQPRKRHPQNNLKKPTAKKSTFLAHITELRTRLFYIVAAVLVGGSAAYAIEDKITAFLLAPARGEQFMYTTPGGGLDFLFRICLYSGIMVAIPVIIYQIISFLSPLLKEQTTRFAFIFSGISALAAAIGVAFGYTVGLPAALKFLIGEFSSNQITANITIQSYLSFVLSYLIGTALLLQMPLILLFINRIKPLKPKSLLKQERWVILGAFVLGAILNPTPSVIDFLFFSLPIVVTYQVGIVLVWFANRSKQVKVPKNIAELRAQDQAILAQRNSVAQKSLPLIETNHAPRSTHALRPQSDYAQVTSAAPISRQFVQRAQQNNSVNRVASGSQRPRRPIRSQEFVNRANYRSQNLDSRGNLA